MESPLDIQPDYAASLSHTPNDRGSSHCDKSAPIDHEWMEYDCLYHIILQSECGAIVKGDCVGEFRLCLVKRHHYPKLAKNEVDILRKGMPWHSNIVKYFAVTENYIFMESIPLGALDSYLVPSLQPPVEYWSCQLCDAINYLHTCGIAHNQLTPHHILVAHEGKQLKICDFAQATLHQSECYQNDIFDLGSLVWFIQQEGRPIPDEMANRAAYDIIHTLMGANAHGLILADFILACFSRTLTASELLGSLSHGATTPPQIAKSSYPTPELTKPDIEGDSSP